MIRKVSVVLSCLSVFLLVACNTGGNPGNTNNPTPAPTSPTYPLGKTFTLSNITLTSGTTSISDISSFKGTVWDDSGKIQLGSITNGVLYLSFPQPADNQLWSSWENLTFSDPSVKWRKVSLFVKKADSDIMEYTIWGRSDEPARADIIYASKSTTVKGQYVGSDTRTYSYDLNLVSGWNWAEWGWPSEPVRTCKSVKSSNYTWILFNK